MALKQLIDENYDLLHRSLNPSSKLFVKLRSVAAITHHLPSIKQQPTVNEKNAALFDALLHVPDDRQEQVVNEFIAALRSTGQDHVANIFRPESNDVPMSDEHYNLLTSKRISICQFIKPKDGLTDHLVFSGVLSDADRTTILCKPQIDDMAEELVNILLRKSDSAFGKFVNALNETGQSHAAYILTGIGPSPMSQQHRKLLEGKLNKLCEFMDVENGLLEQLISKNVVSLVEAERIRSAVDDNEMAINVVNTLLRKHDGAFDDFIDALNHSGQDHITYVLTREDFHSLNSEVIYTPMSDLHQQSLRTKMDELCKFLAVENGLLDLLVSQKVFSLDEADEIRSVSDDSVMARKLVDMLLSKCDYAFDEFINALNYTGQEHVIYVLTGEGDCRPLNDDLRYALLSRHRNQVINMIDSQYSGLVTTLISKGVFSSSDEQRVANAQPDTTYNRNERILNLVARKSQLAFTNFISALNDTDQTHVVVALMGVDVFVKIKELYDSRVDNDDYFLHNVDQELVQLMREMYESNETVVKGLNGIPSENGLALTVVNERCAQVIFTCKTRNSLKHLRQLCRSDEATKLLNETFCPEFADKGLQSVAVEISDEQFDNCEKTFLHLAPMTTQHRKVLESSAESLSKKMIVNDDLLDNLTLCGQHRQSIERAATREQQVKTLLDIVLRRPDVAFEQLIYALNCTRQQKTADFLRANSQSCEDNANILAKIEHQLPVGPQSVKRPLRPITDSGIEVEQVPKYAKMETIDTRRHIDKTFKDLIRENFVLILRCMDSSDEFLGELLLSVRFLSNRLSAGNQHMTIDERTNALLAALLQIPDEFQESVKDSFVAALRNSGQDHVANVFRRESDKVPMSEEHRKILVKHRYQLCQFLDPENGLLDRLDNTGVLSSADEMRIRSKIRLDVMAGELIDTILKKSDDAFDALIQALNETGQSHVTYILTGEGSSRPLNEELSAALISQRHYIVNNMEAMDSGLVLTLMISDVLSQHDMDRVTDNCSEVGVIINETILDLIMRKSQSSFDCFIEALKDTGQRHIATTLVADVTLDKPDSGKPHECLHVWSHLVITLIYRHMLIELSSNLCKRKHNCCLLGKILINSILSHYQSHMLNK